MDVGPARQPHSPLVFHVGAEPHFPRLERFPTVLGLEVPERGQAVNQGWLSLVLGLGPLSKRYRAPKACCCLFERF